MLYADDCEDDPAELRCPPIACLLVVKPTRDFGSRLHSRMRSYTNCWMAGSTGTFGSILSELERGHRQKDFGLPQNTVKGGLCMSGLYEMTPVRLSWRRTYANFTDAMADAMSAQRHIEKLHAEPRKSLLECCEAGLEYGIVRRNQ